jgi:potassium efflux system protein
MIPRLANFVAVLIALTAGSGAVGQESPPTSLDASPESLPPSSQQDSRRRALEEDVAAIERLREQLFAESSDISRRLATLKIGDITEGMVDQLALDVEALRLRQEELQGDIINTEHRIGELEQTIKQLEAQREVLSASVRRDEDHAERSYEQDRLHRQLAQTQTDLSLETQHLTNLKNRLELTKQRIVLLTQWQSKVREIYQQQQERMRRETSKDLVGRLQTNRRAHQDLAASLGKELERTRDSLSEPQQRSMETAITVAEERANLTQLAIRLVDTSAEFARMDELAKTSETEPEELRQGLQQVEALRAELQTTRELVTRKIDIFQQRRQLIERRERLSTETAKGASSDEKTQISAVLQELNRLDEEVRRQLDDAEVAHVRLQDHHREVLSRHLLFRFELPATMENWRRLLGEMAGVPRILFYQGRLILESASTAIKQTTATGWMLLIFAELSLLALIPLIRMGFRRFQVVLRATAGLGFLSTSVKLAAELVHRNSVGLVVSSALLLAIWILQVPQPAKSIVATVVLLSVTVKLFITFAWLVLDSPYLPPERRRPKLYRNWLYTLFLGGVLAAFLILVQLSGVPKAVSDTFERVSMLYLLLLTVPVTRARRFFMDILARQYSGHYWFTALRLVSFLLPLSLCLTAVLGLGGFLNLAWTVAWYLLLSIAVLALWLLVQGLFKDLVGLAKARSAERAVPAPLWTGEIIDPLYKIISILLFLGAFTVLVRLIGWDRTSGLDTAWQVLAVTVLAVMATYEAVNFVAGNAVRRTDSVLGSALVRHSRQPIGIILPIAAVQIIAPTLPLSQELLDNLRHFLVLAQIAAVSWLVVCLVWALDDVAAHQYGAEAADKLGARRVRTQMRMLRQIVIFAVWLIAISAMLMTFPTVRQLGAGLLASAGVVGLVVGIAARPFLANLIAGIQIGLTQPIRLDDEVLVENEWGHIEEINSTHVIIRIWDDRRLVIPLIYFNEKPFQNWTRSSTNLIGAVHVQVDYTFPVEAGRQELRRILDTTSLWDGQVQVLQVTDSKDATLELRLLMSARDAPTAWDLRCYVREKFVEFVRKNYPDSLPRVRAVLVGDKPENEIFVPGGPHTPKSSTA